MDWVAQLTGVLAIGVFALFIAVPGAEVIPAFSWTSPQGLPLLVTLLMALAGFHIACRWKLTEGVISNT